MSVANEHGAVGVLNDWADNHRHQPLREVAEAALAWALLVVEYLAEQANTWQDPLTTLQLGTGDCEDFALLWFLLLRLSGARHDQVRLAHVVSSNGAHMVLVVYPPGGAPFVLDNLHPEGLQPRGAYVPVYEFNEGGIYVDGRLTGNHEKRLDPVLARLAEHWPEFTVDITG